MKRVTAIALSGGVDSLVAAHLLKERGHQVLGIHFLTGFEGGGTAGDRDGAVEKMSRISDQLEIPVYVVDVSDRFKTLVVDYFVKTYDRGRTPNPCLVCNPRVKFGVILEEARKRGASALATGHYARVERDDPDRPRLRKGVDPQKDQSYFLAFLTRPQLSAARFPLGRITKSETYKIASRQGLVPVEKSESQDICFIKDGSYGRFLAAQPGFAPRPGQIVDIEGKVLGRHEGLHLFTVGQRRGINCPGPAPYYVIRLEAERNRLVVGGKEALPAPGCLVEGVNWIAPPPASPVDIEIRLRYRHKATPATLFPRPDGRVVARFETPASAVTPGQGAVFFRGDEVLGGGWIEGPCDGLGDNSH
ncbi:MAG: tRNA 2-thiouridine(34) synthase MnmA [Desulfobacterales bacterium]|nr:tRNA 2-thiouridine(34) synthase MnmA [Desulfobacterales bacterium]